MAEFPYTQSPGNIKKLFEQIQNVGKPEKVNQRWIESIGLKSKNDRSLAGVLKFIGFTDNAGAPTQVWMDYRNKSKSTVVLAQSLRASYSSLFGMYSDAHRKDDEALHNFFNSNTSVGSAIVSAMVGTFKALVSLADFNSEVPKGIEADIAEVTAKKENRGTATSMNNTGGNLALTVNIQLQIPATDDASIYDKFFESLYKHVLSKDKES